MLYNGVLVSAIEQSRSALCIHIPSLLSLLAIPPSSHPLGRRQAPAEFPVLYSSFPGAVCFPHGGMHITCYSLPFLLLPAPQASDSSLSRDLPSTSQPQPGLSGLPLSFLFTDCVTTRGCCSIPRPHLTPPEHKPREGRCDECFIQHSLLTLSPLPGTWGMFNEYSPNG